jgi:hypothetical protein
MRGSLSRSASRSHNHTLAQNLPGKWQKGCSNNKIGILEYWNSDNVANLTGYVLAGECSSHDARQKKDELGKWQKAKGLTSRHSDKAARGARAGARLCARRLVQLPSPKDFCSGSLEHSQETLQGLRICHLKLWLWSRTDLDTLTGNSDNALIWTLG